MDKLHTEYEFIQRLWKFMKECESRQHDSTFWQWAEDTAEKLTVQFPSIDFAAEWLITYFKHIDKEDRKCPT